MHGYGIYCYENDSTYAGEWKNGEIEGKGTHVYGKTGNFYLIFLNKIIFQANM